MDQPGPVSPEWRTAAIHAVLVAAFALGWYVYWFGLADRYAVFLYDHLGATPFDATTTSRYWMTGLVLGGMILLLNTGVCWLIGRTHAYPAPQWWRVWALCAAPVGVGIIWITMTLNTPTLPVLLSVVVALVALASLALALAPGPLAAHEPVRLFWLALNGAGLVPVLLLFKAVELPARLGMNTALAYGVAAFSMGSGAVWLLMSRLIRRRFAPAPPDRMLAVFAAGLAEAYLLLPLAHYFLGTPPAYRYITTASNFFAVSPPLQAAVLVIALGLALGITRLARPRQ